MEILRKAILSFFFYALIFCSLFSTQIIYDNVILEGITYYLNTFPLEPYFKKFPSKRPFVSSYGLRRGYVATFSIKDSLLLIEDVLTFNLSDPELSYKSIKDELFPNQQCIIAEDFTGIISINEVDRHYTNSDSTNSNFVIKYHLIFQISNGIVTKYYELNHEDYKKFTNMQFIAFQLTAKYKEVYEIVKDRLENQPKIEVVDENNEVIKNANAISTVEDYIKSDIYNYLTKILVEFER